MSIMLGNFNVAEIENRLGIKLPEEKAKELSDMQHQNASGIPADKWHCFDIPFMIVCGSMDTAIKVRDMLSPYSSGMKCAIQIGIDKD